MSFSIGISGHIDDPEDGSKTAAEIEVELADKLNAVLASPEYGVTGAQLYGSYGQIDILHPQQPGDVVDAEVADDVVIGKTVDGEPDPDGED